MRPERLLVTVPLAALALAILVFPSDAHAWGPLAHLNFSAQALQALGTVQPSLRQLLQDFGNEFLYGSLAADIVVGKNMARYLYHCHNWRVGFNVFKHARAGGEQAFALGFLSHLAADTVAHNYFVPFKTVASYHKRNTQHAYWELRYDQRMDREPLARRAAGDDPLRTGTTTTTSSACCTARRCIPFGVSKQLFRSLLVSARVGRFHHVSRLALARERNLVLEPDLVVETNELAVEAILGMLAEGERSKAARADATGARNIRIASDLRKQLRERTQRGASTRATRTRSPPRRARASAGRSRGSSSCRPRSRSWPRPGHQACTWLGQRSKPAAARQPHFSRGRRASSTGRIQSRIASATFSFGPSISASSVADTSATRFVSPPNPAPGPPTLFATTRSQPFPLSFSRARAMTSSVSAAKPTSTGPSVLPAKRAPSPARMSGVRERTRVSSPSALLDLAAARPRCGR